MNSRMYMRLDCTLRAAPVWLIPAIEEPRKPRRNIKEKEGLKVEA